MKRICIVSAKRTPQGRFLGSLSKFSAVDLAVAAGQAVMDSVDGMDEAIIDRVIVGNVLGAGLGMNIARQIGVGLGVPVERPAFTVNMMCASGMQALILAAQSIEVGESSVVLCGGTESMTRAPYVSDRARTGHRLGHGTLTDLVLRDGLIDTFADQHMGVSAERLAKRFGITREAQDQFALESQQKTHSAAEAGVFDAELTPVGDLKADEHPRPDTTLEKLATLKPAFVSEDEATPGTVTAGNASGINDGSAMMLVCDEETAARQGWKPLAFMTAYATAGCDPKLMGMGPIHATHRLCEQIGVKPSDFELVELNEAFAAQALICIQVLGLDPARVNVNGGAIALGHPIGASGARIVVHLAHQLAAGKAKNALATLCVGGGMGAAVALEG
ncbi:MAG: acetyl-CoA C-acyltransferase [Pirellulales bacterium]|nr:acetyl-CoA C-acyltransferase [Pirellulales bacterium]